MTMQPARRLPPKVAVEASRLSQLDPVIAAAINDPVGARAYLMRLGEMLGYPGDGMPPIPCNHGSVSWAVNMSRVEPYWLGLAILHIERRWEETWVGESLGAFPSADAPAPTAARAPSKEENPVAIVKPSAAGTKYEEGYYSAVITEVAEKVSQFPNRDTGKMEDVRQFQWQFVLLDQDAKRTDEEIRGYTSQAWSGRSKLYKWASGVLGPKCPKTDEEFDTDTLLNRKCDLYITNKDDQGNALAYSKVASLHRYRSMTVEDEEPADREPVAAF